MTLQTAHLTAQSVRSASRTGAFTGSTAGHCPLNVQANLLVLPAKYANDFRDFCRRNPVSCPLLGENAAPGDRMLPSALAADCDVTTDAPGYNIYRDGQLLLADVPDCTEWWQEDSVAFLIGCSFSFDRALTLAGLVPSHERHGRNVPMYRTSWELNPAGISMRPYKRDQVEAVRRVTRPYRATHGEPVAWGMDAVLKLGINDIHKPDFGDTPVMLPDEVPVFWGCGVTPQSVIMSSPELRGFTIGHAPGKMLCLDLPATATD